MASSSAGVGGPIVRGVAVTSLKVVAAKFEATIPTGFGVDE